MKFSYLVTFVLAFSLSSCNTTKEIAKSRINGMEIPTLEIENSGEFIQEMINKVQSLLDANNYTSFEDLKNQTQDNLEKNSNVVISNFKPESKTGNEMYYHLQKSTILVGIAYMCEHCPNMHVNNATGFIIHEDGIIVTNHHVIEGFDSMDLSSIFATDHDGNVYPVTNVLSASLADDVAILKIDTKGEKLNALPLASQELVGENVYMMGHPFNLTFFMTKGMISRKYINPKTGQPKISITADFAQGASGGPVVNQFGQVVGIVSATTTYYANGSKESGDVQMVVKEVIPVSELNHYIKNKENM